MIRVDTVLTLLGFIIGLTGMGGGALMTPMLVLLFGVSPLTAVSSDLVASAVMKPVGSFVHIRAGTVRWDLVRWLCLGSIPAVFTHDDAQLGGGRTDVVTTTNSIDASVDQSVLFLSYGLGQGATMIAAAWGVFVWKEFRGAPAGTSRLITAMFVLFIAGLAAIIAARVA